MSEAGGTMAQTPEQEAAVRRRALPIAIAGFICGSGGLAMLLTKPIDEIHPPAIFGVNLSFCAMMMGVGILFYARRTPGVRVAMGASLLALVMGMAGSAIFALQSQHWHGAMEQRELGNVAAIATAAREYARHNGGIYPELPVLMEKGGLKTEQFHSPFGNEQTIKKRKELSPAEFEKWNAGHSDYLYFGEGLRLPPSRAAATESGAGAATHPGKEELPAAIIVACGEDAIMRTSLSVGFADGHGEFLDLSEAKRALAASNEARRKLGLPEVRNPESVRKAEELERRE
jgi:hypothetical protein